MAKLRAEYLREIGKLEERDVNFNASKEPGKRKNHVDGSMGVWERKEKEGRERARADDPNSQWATDTTGYRVNSLHPGRFLWLTYVIFDIVYLGGPAAEEFLTGAGVDAGFLKGGEGEEFGGSIMHLDLGLRKEILYKLLEQQKSEVEIAYGEIITSDGR